MKSIMRKRDLTKKLGFPPDIDRSRKIAVIISPGLNHIMYYTKDSHPMIAVLPNLAERVFQEDIYFVTKE